MVEAADLEVFEWYVENYGAEVNLFVDHRQIAQPECLRSEIWGTKNRWGPVRDVPVLSGISAQSSDCARSCSAVG
jgi:phosphosulfolactate synthase (CoM biosynthesis protein A)